MICLLLSIYRTYCFFQKSKVTKSSKKKNNKLPHSKRHDILPGPSPKRRSPLRCTTSVHLPHHWKRVVFPTSVHPMAGYEEISGQAVSTPGKENVCHNFTWKPTFTIYIHLPFINSCIYSVFFFENVCTLTYIYHYSCHKIKQMYLKMNDMSTLKRDGFFFLREMNHLPSWSTFRDFSSVFRGVIL